MSESEVIIDNFSCNYPCYRTKSVKTDTYLEVMYKTTGEEINYHKDKITVLDIMCECDPALPYEMLVLDNDRLLINIEGILFFLERS